MGWGGVFGGTQQLYAKLRAAYDADPSMAESPPARPGGIRETVQPDLGANSDMPTTSAWAIISLLFGILSALMACFLFPLVMTSPVAIVTGHIARYAIRQSRGRKTGAGLALAGLVIGYGTLLMLIVFFALAIVGPFEFSIPAVSEPQR